MGKQNANTTTALAVNTPVPEVLAAIKAKIESLKHIHDTPWKTSGVVPGFSRSLKEETDKSVILKMLSVILAKEHWYDKAAELAGITSYAPFNEGGGTAADWIADVKLRGQIIEHKETLDKLKEAEGIMSKFLSEADQREMAMKQVQALLS